MGEIYDKVLEQARRDALILREYFEYRQLCNRHNIEPRRIDENFYSDWNDLTSYLK
jgi:hypothetical protein